MKGKVIHLEWEGPYTFEECKKLNDEDCDYGIYQIYGPHHCVGPDVLLYTGKADLNTFSARINEHEKYYQQFCSYFKKINIYIGRLAGNKTPSNNERSNQIDLTEKILIFSHKPPHNAKEVKWLSIKKEPMLRKIHVLNWGNYKNLFPEVSGHRWTDKSADIDNYEVYGNHSK
jgi:hypothetical protein